MQLRNHQVAIQGTSTSFHDIAAKKYFGNEITVIECGSFKEVCMKVKNNVVDFGVLAIENKIAGSILLNYQLINDYDLNIVGETYLPIELNLYGNANSKIKSIREIVSHPMALAQSQHFLAELDGVKITEYKDTATSAKLVLNDHTGQTAVIAGPLTGENGLHLLKRHVCDVKENYTRFYIICKGKSNPNEGNTASIMVQTPSQPGSLLKVLELLKKQEINLTKIQSVPVTGLPNHYAFHLDLEFNKLDQYEKAEQSLQKTCTYFKQLGIYHRSKEEINIVHGQKHQYVTIHEN